MKNVLVSVNIGGNTHDAVAYVNKVGLADNVIHIASSGFNSIVVFRVPEDHELVRKESED